MQVLLISDQCTTGWAHWGHGQLWLTHDSLVRVGLRSLTARAATRGGLANFGAAGGLAARALEKRRGLTTEELERSKVTGDPVEVDADEWHAYLAKHEPMVLKLEFYDILQANLRNGVSASRLLITTREGARRKLLWTPNRVAGDALRRALAAQLSSTSRGG